MEQLERGLRPSDILTRASVRQHVRQCMRDRRIDQHRPPLAGDGARGRDPTDDRRLQRNLRPDAAHRRPDAGRKVHRGTMSTRPVESSSSRKRLIEGGVLDGNQLTPTGRPSPRKARGLSRHPANRSLRPSLSHSRHRAGCSSLRATSPPRAASSRLPLPTATAIVVRHASSTVKRTRCTPSLRDESLQAM